MLVFRAFELIWELFEANNEHLVTIFVSLFSRLLDDNGRCGR